VLGWAHAPAAIASRGGARLGLVARLATLAVFFGDAMLAVVMAAVGMVELVPDAVSMANAAGSAFIVFFVFGLLIFGVPAWVLAAAVCALWVTVIAGGAGGDGSSDGRHGA
jgi:hypothetical protein